jgi:hypothetical protein
VGKGAKAEGKLVRTVQEDPAEDLAAIHTSIVGPNSGCKKRAEVSSKNGELIQNLINQRIIALIMIMMMMTMWTSHWENLENTGANCDKSLPHLYLHLLGTLGCLLVLEMY